jgi:hypothetical protein
MNMRILSLGFALSLSGCISYPSNITAESAGIVVDESGAPVEGAIVCAVVYKQWPFPRLFSYENTRAGADGSFKVKAPGRVERGWFPFMSLMSPEPPAYPGCAACRPGSQITHFPCNANAKVTLHPMVVQISPATAKMRNRASGEFDVMANLLSECDVNIPPK